MEINVPEIGATPAELCQAMPGEDENDVLEAIAALVRAGQAHMRGDTVFPGKRRPGRPTADNPRVPITIRLPPDMVGWLRSKKRYTKLIEELLRVEMARDRQHTSMLRND